MVRVGIPGSPELAVTLVTAWRRSLHPLPGAPEAWRAGDESEDRYPWTAPHTSWCWCIQVSTEKAHTGLFRVEVHLDRAQKLIYPTGSSGDFSRRRVTVSDAEPTGNLDSRAQPVRGGEGPASASSLLYFPHRGS